MAVTHRKGALALFGGALALASAAPLGGASAQDAVRRPVPARHTPVPRAREARVAEARPLTIRRRPVVAPVDVVGAPGFYGDDYLVRQHSWNDTNLYYWGPFRTGGDVKYGDVAGNPITRGNPGLGQVAGYGPARGGYGGPHFDAVGGFHNEPGPDYGIDRDYASGSLSTPDYGDLAPRYPSVKQQVAALRVGALPHGSDTTTALNERGGGRKLAAEGRSTLVSFEDAKQQFAAPMRREAPVEAGFGNGGLGTIGMQIGNGEF